MVQRSDYGGGTTILTSPTDYLYVGFERRFDAIMTWMYAVDTDPGDLEWYFSVEGSTATSNDWVQFLPLQPKILNFRDNQEHAYWDTKHFNFAKWRPIEIESGDGDKYWIRVKATNTTTGNQVSALSVRPYAIISSEDVKDQLQRVETFTEENPPNIFTVEDQIRESESSLFASTGYSYRPEFIEEEVLNFRTYGITLRHRPVLDFLKLESFEGNGWTEKDRGRNQEWHIDETMGIIYLSTIFLGPIPPSLRRGFSERRNQGAFKRPLRVQYVHGRDSKVDPFFDEVKDILTKKAAVDISINYDFALLLPSGVDRVSLEKKIELWNADIEEFKEKYTKFVMY